VFAVNTKYVSLMATSIVFTFKAKSITSYFFRVVCFGEFGSQSIFAVEKGGLGELFLGCYLQ